MMIFERDPEELGSESYEDTEFRMDMQQSIHDFQPGPDGRCTARMIRHGALGRVCGSTQSYSVFHIDEREWCCSLSQQGIDCGHGEEDWE